MNNHHRPTPDPRESVRRIVEGVYYQPPVLCPANGNQLQPISPAGTTIPERTDHDSIRLNVNFSNADNHGIGSTTTHPNSIGQPPASPEVTNGVH